MADEDAGKAYKAIGRFLSNPDLSIPFLLARVKAQDAPADVKRIRQLIVDLESPQFRVREKATSELARLGDIAKPELRKGLDSNPTPERRRRLETLLRDPDAVVITPEHVRMLRVLEVLERSPAARPALETLAKSEASSFLTEQAQASLQRLSERATKVQTNSASEPRKRD